MWIQFYPYPALIGMTILVILLPIIWQKKHNLFYLFCFSVFWIYLLGVVSATLIPFPPPLRGELRTPVSEILSRINLIPFNFGGLFDLHPNIAILELGGNILLTVPFGFMIPFLIQVKGRQIPWLALAVGLSTELSQLAACLILGTNYRSVDINDVILNAVGAIIGYGLLRGLAWLSNLLILHIQSQRKKTFVTNHKTIRRQ
jgi:glycopeptide antibiotics resistance protein